MKENSLVLLEKNPRKLFLIFAWTGIYFLESNTLNYQIRQYDTHFAYNFVLK